MAGTFDVRVVMDAREIARFAAEDPGVVREMSLRGERVKQRARELVGVHTPPAVEIAYRRPRNRPPGTLRDSIVKRFVQTSAGIVIQVGSEDEIALWHHEGTDPHVIVPRDAQRLVFWSNRWQTVVVARRVNHPGTRPNRFLVEALAAAAG